MTAVAAQKIAGRILLLPADAEPADCVFECNAWIEGDPVEVRR